MPIGRDLLHLRRGAKATIPVLDDGEPGWAKDEKALYVGTPEGNERLPNRADVEGINTQLDDIVDVAVKNFLQPGDVTYDAAIGRAISSVGADTPVQLTFPRGDVPLNEVVTRKNNLFISAYGTRFIPKSNTGVMWTHYGTFFFVEGCKVESDIIDTYRGFKIINDVTTINSSYAHFRDVVMNDIYQAIDFYNTSGLGGACYRHELENVRITNYTNPKTRAGSFGIRFGGNVEGDSSGNDSRLRGVFVKAYEKNVIIQKSVGTKFTQCSIDGGGVALELDGGSYISLCQCYIEYNDTFLNAVNNPYRPMLLATTVSNYTTYMVGTLYNSEELLDYSSNSPIIMKRKRTFNGQENLIVRPIAPHGGGLEINNDGKSFDFIKVGTKYALVPTEDIDLYEHIPVGKKKFFGNILSTDFTSIDEYGVVRYSKLLPNSGLVTVAAGTTSPDVGRNPILVTSNTSATTIVRFDYGIVGQKMNLIINDAFTTIAHNTNIKLKGKANKACAVDDTFEFICTAAPTDTTCVWYEI